MKKTYWTRILVSANVAAVLAIAGIILLHNLQSQQSNETETRTFNKHVETVQFHPMFDPEETNDKAFTALFAEDESEETEEDIAEESTEESEEEEITETENEEAYAQQETTQEYDVSDSSTNNAQTNNQVQTGQTSGGSQSSSASSSSQSSGTSNNSSSSEEEPTDTGKEEVEAEEPTTLECKWTQSQQGGKCVNKSYLSLVKSQLPAPYTASGGDTITISYSGAQVGFINKGKVSGDGELQKGNIGFGGSGYDEDRKASVVKQLSGLIY